MIYRIFVSCALNTMKQIELEDRESSGKSVRTRYSSSTSNGDAFCQHYTIALSTAFLQQ